MTGRELHKLRRQDLLELLLEQSKVIAGLQAEHEERDMEAQQFEESNQRLGAKVEEKDVLIQKLQGRLNTKTERIKSLEDEMETFRRNRQAELEQTDSIAGAALRLNGIFEVAQQAADQYLYNVRQRYGQDTQTSYAQPEDIGRSGE